MPSSFQEVGYPYFQSFQIPELALPDYEEPPTEQPELSLVTLVTSPILFKFRNPELMSRLRQAGKRAFLCTVPMPKTAVNENDFVAATEYKVRIPWQFSIMKSVSVPKRVNKSPYE